MSLEEVRVHHRSGQWCPGVRQAGVVAYDVKILPRWQVEGRPTTDRCFVLPGEGVQLTRPGTFVGAVEGAWYVDLVDVEETTPGSLVVTDLYVDLIVPRTSRHYELLDLDELAEALENGSIDAPTTARVLRDTQRFVDAHLRDLTQDPPGPWPDFPPSAINPLIDLPPFG